MYTPKRKCKSEKKIQPSSMRATQWARGKMCGGRDESLGNWRRRLGAKCMVEVMGIRRLYRTRREWFTRNAVNQLL